MKKLQLCSVAPAHRHMQYLGELVFFHTPLICKGVWKNTNSSRIVVLLNAIFWGAPLMCHVPCQISKKWPAAWYVIDQDKHRAPVGANKGPGTLCPLIQQIFQSHVEKQ